MTDWDKEFRELTATLSAEFKSAKVLTAIRSLNYTATLLHDIIDMLADDELEVEPEVIDAIESLNTVVMNFIEAYEVEFDDEEDDD